MTATPTKLPELPEVLAALEARDDAKHRADYYFMEIGFAREHQAAAREYEEAAPKAAALMESYVRAATLSPGCEWQPIGSSPRGEFILIAFRGGQIELMRRTGSPGSLTKLGATHWMPLPAPPATGETK